jgi:site-specific DNA recombinase
MKAPSVKTVRCAIYTRVSTEHGLDQEFNSLDAQYDAASAYIKSQAHAGGTPVLPVEQPLLYRRGQIQE